MPFQIWSRIWLSSVTSCSTILFNFSFRWSLVKDFISAIENQKLVEKLQFPKLIDLKCLKRNYKREHGSVCPQYMAPILVIEKHRSNSSSNRMTPQEWERCLKIVTVQGKKGSHSNFKKEDVDFLIMDKEAGLVKPKSGQPLFHHQTSVGSC